MIIISQKEDVIVNFENVDAIGFKSNEFDKRTIVAHLIGGNSVELATYETENRAKKEFDDLIDFIVNDCTAYCMPEEYIEENTEEDKNVTDIEIQD